ncbi:uncharacterized protein [Chelonus insularis]|uniref:uncharacterized protein n=1 Tax=Chelonus insularis TaxID=460826 RepID=UPI0015899EE3|nr:uncharacterized protein LOC118071233 [Chelonus insularis]
MSYQNKNYYLSSRLEDAKMIAYIRIIDYAHLFNTEKWDDVAKGQLNSWSEISKDTRLRGLYKAKKCLYIFKKSVKRFNWISSQPANTRKMHHFNQYRMFENYKKEIEGNN